MAAGKLLEAALARWSPTALESQERLVLHLAGARAPGSISRLSDAIRALVNAIVAFIAHFQLKIPTPIEDFISPLSSFA